MPKQEMKNNTEKRITFEDIKKANESIVTTAIERKDNKTGNISRKDYAEVNQRIKAFRMVYPTSQILTEMVSNQNGVCVFRAYVYGDEGNLLATGTAYEKESSSFINKTSYIENCETSAIGRALGIAGFGIDVSVASYEEVANAMENQNKPEEKPKKKTGSNIPEPTITPKMPKVKAPKKAEPKQGMTNQSPLTPKTMQRVIKAQSLLNGMGVGFHKGESDYSQIVSMCGVEKTSVDELSEEEAQALLNEAYLPLYAERNK